MVCRLPAVHALLLTIAQLLISRGLVVGRGDGGLISIHFAFKKAILMRFTSVALVKKFICG